MANWKAPGPDMLQVFWLKKLTAVHPRLTTYLNELLQHPEELPKWLVKGRTQLILKNENKEATPDNFRPITCLPTIWKL